MNTRTCFSMEQNMMKMLIFCITLFYCAHTISTCEYGKEVCEWKSTRIKWKCDAGEKLLARAFWGRDPGDNKTCVDGVSYRNLQNLNCSGSDDKALAAVSEWCNSHVDGNDYCKIKATVRKLQIGGKNYDPCPGTFKYLRVCSTCIPDCDYGQWSDWGSCSKTCAGGEQIRTRKGHNLPECDLQETTNCNTEDCPTCEYGNKIYEEGDVIQHKKCSVCYCERKGISCTKAVAAGDCDCKDTEQGMEYMGRTDTTITGNGCTRWSLVGFTDDDFPGETMEDAKNYCRNTIRRTKKMPWCYDLDRYQNYCNIPLCSDAA